MKDKRIEGPKRHRRKEHEFAPLRDSVRSHCLECVSYSTKEVELCPAEACWLWPWRLGKTPEVLKRKPASA